MLPRCHCIRYDERCILHGQWKRSIKHIGWISGMRTNGMVCVEITTSPLHVNLCIILTFAKGEVQSHISEVGLETVVAGALSFFRTIRPNILFPGRGSPLTTDLCLSESRSVPVPAILQAARKKPLLSYSRRSGLSANYMLSSPGQVSRCVPCGRSEVQCLVARPMHVEASLEASKTR